MQHAMHAAERVVAGAADVIGYTIAGRPVYRIAGGDGTATIDDQIKAALKEADELKSAPEWGADQDAKAESILEHVKELQAEKKKASRTEKLKAAMQGLAAEVGGDDLPEVKGTGAGNVVTLEDVLKMSGQKQRGTERKSWGAQVVESEQFKSTIDRFRHGEDIVVPEKARVEMPPVPLKAIFTEGSATQGGSLLAPDERGLLDQGPFMRPLTLRDLITVGRTSQLSIRYARFTAFTNAATGVHEASTATGTNAAGGLKPQSDLVTEVKTATVVTIAHWFAVTKQSLSDIPLLQTYIDSYGRYGLFEEEEDQIIAGTGSANDQLEGFNTVSGIQTQAFVTDIFTSVRKAITKITTIGRARATGVLLNPADDETIDLTRVNQGGGAGTGMWLGNGPWAMGPPTLWGLPRAVSEAVPAGKAYVADFRTILLAVREDPSMAMTDSHADYFVRNLIALLFEERATQLVIRPKAIVEVATA